MRKLIILLPILTISCTKTVDPVTEINDSIQQSATELVQYAKNNMQIDTEKQLLLNGIKDCAARADALTKNHESLISKCETEKSKIKIERNVLGIILLGLVGFMLFRPLRKIFGL